MTHLERNLLASIDVSYQTWNLIYLSSITWHLAQVNFYNVTNASHHSVCWLTSVITYVSHIKVVWYQIRKTSSFLMSLIFLLRFQRPSINIVCWNWEAMTPFDECSIISLIVSISSRITYTQSYLTTDNYLNESVYYKFLA